MAKPIKHTPVLKGKEARKFSEAIQKSSVRAVSAAEFAEMKENFGKLQAISQKNAVSR